MRFASDRSTSEAETKRSSDELRGDAKRQRHAAKSSRSGDQKMRPKDATKSYEQTQNHSAAPKKLEKRRQKGTRRTEAKRHSAASGFKIARESTARCLGCIVRPYIDTLLDWYPEVCVMAP